MLVVFSAVFIAVFIGAICFGRHSVPIGQTLRLLANQVSTGLLRRPLEKTWTDSMKSMVISVRLPRVIATAAIGAALSVSGATYQGIFKNPLVSPDLLGVSAGATVGASAAILLGLSSSLIQICALAGGICAVLITVSIPRLFSNNSSTMLVLAGIVVSGFMSALQGLAKYVADPESQLASIVFWTMGSLASVMMKNVLPVLPAIVIALGVILGIRWRVNLLSLGTAEAQSLGVNIALVRGVAVICSTILTACSVCISGTIGWVGLVIPHFSRLLIGEDNRYMIPAAMLLGAVFMIVVDTAARTLTSGEIPLSIITGLLGTPIFILLLKRQKSRIT
jgi:ABC-type Fe3+-siderophore transport system, permease component